MGRGNDEGVVRITAEMIELARRAYAAALGTAAEDDARRRLEKLVLAAKVERDLREEGAS